MKSVIVIIFGLISAFSVRAQHADDVVGTYYLPNNLGVEIYKAGNNYHGKIVSIEGFNNGHRKDHKNPDKAKRDEDLLGKEIITNLEYDKGTKQWINGKMYGPGKGLIFNLKVNKVLDDEIEVVGSKYFFWKTMRWKKG